MSKAKNKKHFIGITLLFSLKKGELYSAFLKSYLLEVSSWDNLLSKMEIIWKNESKMNYQGIEDVFYTSGDFKEEEVIGKSFLDTVKTLKAVRAMVFKNESYLHLFGKNLRIKKEKWFLVSLIYFYNNIEKNDKLTITCNSPIRGANIDDIQAKLNGYVESKEFLKKVIPYKIDKMPLKKISFIGIESIKEVAKEFDRTKCFEVLYREKMKLHDLKSLLPTDFYLRRAFKNGFARKL